MSHYSVAVFTEPDGEGVDELLAPFNENTEAEPYISKTRSQVIEYGRAVIDRDKEEYEKYLADPEAFAKAHLPSNEGYYRKITEEYSKRMKWTDDEVYTWTIEYYFGNDNVDEDGNVWSTYNPYSKWDWYAYGGRFGGDLILRPKPGDDEYDYRDDDGLYYTDDALVSRVDFEEMRKQKMSSIYPYDEFMKRSFYGEEYLKSRYPNEEMYLKAYTEFSTYAVITPDGEWHAPGEMGWFACSTETPEEASEWDEKYYERFIEPAIEKGWEIHIVDCHI